MFNPLRGVVLATVCGSITPNIGGSITAVSDSAEGGETLAAFYARCIGTIERIAAAHPGKTVVIVAHGGVMDCLYRAATRLALDAPRSWTLGNAAINRLLYSPEGFSLIGWNDDAHLQGLSLDEIESA